MVALRTPEPDEEGMVHDEVTLEALSRRNAIVGWALRREIIDIDPDTVAGQLEFELEYRVGEDIVWANGDVPGRRVDLAILHNSRPVLLLEIKSKREAQSASNWTAQVRKYAQHAPTVLVVAHDLSPVIARYLTVAKIPVLDLRTL